MAAAAVLAVVLGATAYAGVRLWYGSGPQPEDATPANVVAFARLDLSPGYGQRLKINNLIGKFPRAGGGEDAVDQLEKKMFELVGISEQDYRAHVEPWFAKRIGVAVWFDANDRPYPLVVLNSADDDAARTGLAELQRKRETLGFVVRDGHALIAADGEDAQAAAEAADADARRESLAGSANFSRGVDWLPGQQTGLAWVDMDRFRSLAERVGEADEISFLGDLKGQLIVGAAATDDGVELRFRGFGTGAQPPAGDARSKVDSLPGDSVLAASLRLDDLGAGRAGLSFLMGPGGPHAENPLAALSGATITGAVASLTGDPVLAAFAETDSPDKAATLAEALEELGDEVTVTTDGNRVEVKTEGYAPGGGTLSQQALYRQALAGAPDDTYAVIYFDVQRAMSSPEVDEQDRRDFAAVKAVGVAVGAEAGDPVGLLRVVIS